jgi:sigma-B regulation protein RsbU (phosphoserine phosphatase)
MKYIRGLKIGGLQQKIFNLMLLLIIALVGIFAAVSVYQQNHLAEIVEGASREQQASIAAVSEETMEAVLEASMTKTTALQAYIAGDLFGDVKSDVLDAAAFAAELFEHADAFSPHPFFPARQKERRHPPRSRYSLRRAWIRTNPRRWGLRRT